jgi:hypothetical protein
MPCYLGKTKCSRVPPRKTQSSVVSSRGKSISVGRSTSVGRGKSVGRSTTVGRSPSTDRSSSVGRSKSRVRSPSEEASPSEVRGRKRQKTPVIPAKKSSMKATASSSNNPVRSSSRLRAANAVENRVSSETRGSKHCKYDFARIFASADCDAPSATVRVN